MRNSRWVLLTVLLFLSGCGSSQTGQAKPGNILIIGDSLTAGYGLDDPSEQAWPARLEAEWHRDGFLTPDQRIINAGISGDTSTGGLARLGDLLEEHQPSTVVIALGSNDVRRQTSQATIERNLGEMTRQAQSMGATVLLVGVDLPRPLAFAARGQPNASIERTAEQYGTQMATIPLDKISSDGNMLSDQIHPAASGQATIEGALSKAIREAASP